MRFPARSARVPTDSAHPHQPMTHPIMPVPTLPEKLQTDLKAALEAAAIPRWCDPALLAAVLGISPVESADRIAHLRRLDMVEPVPAYGEHAVRVPEASRQLLRRIMATVEPSRFRALSLRTANCFRDQPAAAARIEWIFHLLCGDPDRGASELAMLDQDWTERGRTGEREALAAVLRELEDPGVLAGRARAWVLLVMAWTHEAKAETLPWAALGETALQAARGAGDSAAEAEALCLIGDARKVQSRFEEADAAYREFLALGQRLAEQQPDSHDWQRKVAVAHSRIGDAAQAQGKLEAAQAAFTEGLALNRRMVRQYPDDTGWQRELGVAHSRLGHVLRLQGQLDRARADFADYLAAFRKLVEKDPANLGWQRELAIACGLVAQIRLALDGAAAALPYYEESARLLADVVAKAPGVMEWAEDKRTIDKELATCRRSTDVQKRVKSGLNWLRDKMP